MTGALSNIIYNLPFMVVAIIISISFYIMVTQKNLIKMVMGLGLLASGGNLFIVALGYRTGGVAPVYTLLPQQKVVLPVPQALTLTSIVVAVATLALMLSFIIHIYRKTGSIDSEKSRIMKG
jgi:multicomponent Na+:H+ antiporter subunit C